MKKFLIVRFSSIGDIVLTSPIIKALKQIPNAEIHFITKAKFKDTLINNPNIDRLFTFEKEISEVLKELRLQKYDLIIDLHNNLRSLRLKLALGVRRVKFDKLNFKKWLFVNFKINVLPKKHIVERYFDTLEELKIGKEIPNTEYFISEQDDKKALDFKQSLGENYIALVVGGAHFTKQIPVEIFDKIIPHLKHPIVLMGGRFDKKKAEKIIEGHHNKIFNLCGELSLNESAAVLKYASIVLTSDTGMMHIAACFEKPIVSVWGNTVPEFGMYPFYLGDNHAKSYIFQVNDLSCRPCSKIGFRDCPKNQFDCMLKQDVEGIIRKLNH